jgi:hypothetical protein
MFEFLSCADPTIKMFWYVALPASLIFVIQLVLTLVGGDASDGVDADFNGDIDADGPFQLLSFRNLINFLLGFGWGGISFSGMISNSSLLIFVAVLTGVFFLVLFLFIMRQLMKFQEDNTVKITDSINKTGSAYLTIPANRSGYGKIQISIGGSQKEFDAVTDGDALPSGSAIRVVDTLSENLCLVTKL